ncbi:hypothetical protein M426DRAFT_12148 [Hypoxylon sp. CI-4A]|nr:hypothetical protein M426DRAFT_12148 [Hypoxylon sp. CI-4A]
MGRTEPSVGRPPASFRRDVRAKRAKAIVNKVIPSMLAAHPRARRGVEASELIIDPAPASPASNSSTHHSIEQGNRRSKKGDKPSTNHKNGTKHADETQTPAEPKRNGPRISLRITDTLTAAHSLLLVPTTSTSTSTPTPPSSSSPPEPQRRDLSNTTARVGILNMASPLTAGGGFLNGAAGQEEASLCTRTTLFPSLRDEFYRLPEVGVVFTPDVLVFRRVGSNCSGVPKRRSKSASGGGHGGDEIGQEAEVVDEEEELLLLPKRERWFLDVATAAMLRLPEIDVDAAAATGFARYSDASDREMAGRKMRAVLRVFAARGVKRIVLGAWGCGAYGNPVGEIARAWRRVLLVGGGKENGSTRRGKGKKESKEKIADSWEGTIEEVVFAIRDAGMARPFALAFGEEFLDGYDGGEDEDGLSDGDGEEEEEEDAKVKELREKIRELELRVEQAKTPQLQNGLNSVLVGLRNQLPDSDDGPSQLDSMSHEHSKSEDEAEEEEHEMSGTESAIED